MTPSTRITTLNGQGTGGQGEGGQGDDGWGVYYRSREMEAGGARITHLTIGDHDLTTPAPIIDAMEVSARGGHTGYAAVPGTARLRDTIATRVQARTGVTTTADQVLVVPGGQAGLFAAFMGTLDPGDRAAFLDPYYATYPGTIRAASGVPVPIATRAETGFQPQPEDLITAQGCKALLVNTPNNPTGAVYGAPARAAIAQAAKAHDLWVIADEVYDTQVWDGHHVSLRSLPGMAERTLVIGSMSKSHMMTGWRLGWVVGPADMIKALSDLATNTTYGVPGFIQDAALTALRDGAQIERDVAQRYRARRDAALSRLSNHLPTVPSAGAMFLMVDIRQTGLSGKAFALGLLETHHIAVMPGESFGKAAAGHVRVALTVPQDTLLPALDTLVAYARQVTR
ncbi:MAG: aminotransferase class I/II-fold pyridoxal phosphate-dependent enzyme [Pseudomonadota bacterium]